MTLVCVPIMVDEVEDALRDAALAGEHGADLVEFRVDVLFEDRGGETLELRIARVLELVERCGPACIVTCRPEWEGGDYTGDDDERVSLYEALGTSEHPPAYIDVELATYTRSANIRQKINLAVDHPKQERKVSTRLILSAHDFEGRPSDLTRKILAMNAEDACAVVKVAYRARSIRDNLDLFEILSERQKPTIALGMGEFGLMSRVLAPKFGGFLTFASLRDEEATAPGQPTLGELLGLYRFRSIGAATRVYGVIGWPVGQSMSPLVHNAGFGRIGFDGVYVPMPVEGSYESFKATLGSLMDSRWFAGASVTIPHKAHAVDLLGGGAGSDDASGTLGAANTVRIADDGSVSLANTDVTAIEGILGGGGVLKDKTVLIVGAGGVARAATGAAVNLGARVLIANRTPERAERLARELCGGVGVYAGPLGDSGAVVVVNATPIGMVGGPDPEGSAVPVDEMSGFPSGTVFFDTVYNPVETPMLRAARERGYATIDGAAMFVKQAAAQFELWTERSEGVEELFDRLVRERLSGGGGGE